MSLVVDCIARVLTLKNQFNSSCAVDDGVQNIILLYHIIISYDYI